MVRAANESMAEWIKKGRFSARVGDGMVPKKYFRNDEEGFDLVFGVWFLNYAGSGEEMSNMWRTISMNLKPGGVFVGMTPGPSDDLQCFQEEQNGLGRELGVEMEYVKELDNREGWRTHIRGVGKGEREGEVVEFDNFHLKKSVYEEAARQGGMKGNMEWRAVALPETEEQRATFAVQDWVWDVVMKAPYFTIVVAKPS